MGSSEVLWDVVEEHLDEAAFLWTRWERSLDSPIYSFEEASRREERRLLAHLAGLVAGGAPVADGLLRPALDAKDPARTAAAACALLGARHGDELPFLIDTIYAAENEGIMLALERSPRADVSAKLLAALGGETDARILRALAFRHADAGDKLKAYFTSADPALRSAAVLAARCPEGQLYRGFVARAISAADPQVRDAAIETGLVLGMASAWNPCLELARTKDEPALLATAVLGGESEKELVLAAKRSLFAIGFSGWKAAAEICRASLAEEKLGALAGEAFCAITGLDPTKAKKDERPTEPEQPIPLEEDDLNANLVPGPEASLPMLDRDKVDAWWKGAEKGFDSKTRYLAGEPWSPAVLARSLVEGSTRRRHLLAFAVAVRTKGRIDISTRAWSAGQRTALGSIDRLNVAELTQPIAKILT